MGLKIIGLVVSTFGMLNWVNITWQGGLQEGGRIGDLFAYKMIGVYSTDEEAQNANEPIDNVITVPDKPNMVVMQSGKILMVMV